MTAQRIGSAYPSENLSATVALLTALVGEPAFVDGDRWAQFDVGGTRIMLAGSDRDDETPFLAVKVNDLDATLNHLRSRGFQADEPRVGPHERRATVHIDHETRWHISVYEPLP